MTTLRLNVFVPAAVCAISLTDRSVGPPCFINEARIQSDVDLCFESSFEKIQEQVRQLKARVELRIAKMELTYCIDVGSDDLNTIISLNSSADNHTFLDDYMNNQTSFSEKITGHYEMLNQVAYNLEELSKSAATIYAKRKLLEIQGLVYDVMCTIKTFLRSKNENPNSEVPSGGKSFHHSDICLQHESEYKTMLNAHSIATNQRRLLFVKKMRKSAIYVIEREYSDTKNDTNVDEREVEFTKFKHLDKGWSYVILLASFCTCCTIGANNYGTGIIHKILLERYNESVVLTSWSGSLQLALMCLAAPLSSALIDKYSCRISVVLSGILFACGYCATAFAPNMYVAILTCGVTTGIAAGLGYTASIVAIGYNFRKRKQVALGITLSGMGAGIFALAPLMNLAHIYFGSTGFFIVMASLSVNIVTFGALYFPSKLEKYTHEQRNKDSESINKGKHLGKIFKMYYKSVLKKPIIFLSLATFVFCGGTDMIFLNLPTFVEVKGFSSTQAALIVSLNGIMSVIGRVLTGFIANFRKINLLTLYSGSLLIVAASIAMYPSVANIFHGHIIFSSILGLFFGCGYLLISPVCSYFVDIQFTSAAIGFVLFFGGAGSIFGPMLAGVIVDNGGTYDLCLYTAGGLVILAAAVGLFISCSYNKQCERL